MSLVLIEKFKSFRIFFGKHPREAYSQAALQHLCNNFSKVPLELLTYYFKYYSGLLVPTYRSFNVLYRERDGAIYVNKVETVQQKPPHVFVQINSDDECFLDDLQILRDDLRVIEYIKLYTEVKNKPVVENDDNILCNECLKKKPSDTLISCSGDHTICQDCLRIQAKRIVNKEVTSLRFVCAGGSVEKPCFERFDRGDVEQCLNNHILFQQLVEMGAFDVKLEQPFPKLTQRELNDRGWLCPIRRKIMKNPVICSDGFTYDYEAIRDFYNELHISPMTFKDLHTLTFDADEQLREKTAEYLSVYPEE